VTDLWRLAPQRVAEFDAAAAAYDTYRPRYPAAVFEDLAEQAGAGAHLVEVGAGTGIATEALVECGFRVVAIDPAPAMVAVAKAKLGAAADLWTGRFEDWEPQSTVDVIAAFNSWHWVEPRIGVPKAAEVLRSGGLFALTWTDVVQYGQAPFEQRLLEELGWRPTNIFDRVTSCLGGIDQDDRFNGPVVRRHRFQRRIDAKTYIEVSRTYGASLGTEFDATIENLINQEFGGHVDKVEDAVLYLYRRRVT
jgi:SAM-dependent methyltransferase